MTKNRNDSGFAHLAIITIVLAVAVIGLLGYVFWQNFMQPKNTKVNNTAVSTNTNTGKSNNSTTPDPTEGWKTYNFNGLTFKYQPNWSIEYNPTYSYILNIKSDVTRYDDINKVEKAAGIHIAYTNDDGSGLDQYINKLIEETSTAIRWSKKSDITINGKSAYRFDNTGCCGSYANDVYFVANNKIWNINEGVGGPLTKTDLDALDPKFNLFLQTITF